MEHGWAGSGTGLVPAVLHTPREQGENGPRAGSVEHTPLSDATHVLSALLIRELDIGLTPKSLIERDTTYTAIFSYKYG